MVTLLLDVVHLSLDLGASLFVNGFQMGFQLYPKLFPGNNNFSPAPAALCMGQCGMKTSTTTATPVVVTPRNVNVSAGNIVVAGTDASTLADNSLLSVLGMWHLGNYKSGLAELLYSAQYAFSTVRGKTQSCLKQ